MPLTCGNMDVTEVTVDPYHTRSCSHNPLTSQKFGDLHGRMTYWLSRPWERR